LLGIEQVYWAVLTAVIVMQASVGGLLNSTNDRWPVRWSEPFAALGAVIPHPGSLATACLLAAALIPLAALVAWWPSYRVAPVTAIVVLFARQRGSAKVKLSAASSKRFSVG